MSCFKNYLNSTPESTTAPALFVDAYKETRVNVRLCFLQMQKKIRVFEKALIEGYSCVNTRAAFDAEIFLRDKDNEKVLFQTAEGEVKRFSSKIIKMDENSQYGLAMTKPLPYGCIKLKKSLPTLEELKELLANVTLDNKIGNLFIVDIFLRI